MAKLRIILVKSGIGYKEDQKRTLKALGFHRLNQSVIRDDSRA
ncbi:MAG: 50S ribosomal protein L30, partial [Chloroflexi bacterium]|nr:50S ribosomal protein L30 [Chloroflexota bacterium]